MGYNPEIYANVRREFEQARQKRIEEAEERLRELHSRFPDIAELDRALAAAGAAVMGAAIGGGDVEKKIEELKNDNLQMQKIRGEFLESHGYPANYSDIKYNCTLCRDTGFDGKKMCSCIKSALVMEGLKNSGLGNLVNIQSFDNFSLDYYKNDPTVYDTMKFTLNLAQSYAENFKASGSDSMLLMGSTGLGKTHISTSVAKRIIERGFDVLYDSAQNIFSDFEFDKFRSNDKTAPKSDRYLECELLIIDDLGTELKSQFSISCLYHIINTRLNHSLATIISTNLSQSEIRARYSDRIASRFFGEFKVLMFRGNDIRAQKIK